MGEQRRLRVVHVESPSKGRQGDSVYRTLQPCDALGAQPGVEVLSGTVLSPHIHAAWWSADVVVLCDVVDADCLPLIAHRRARGLPTVYEINDDFRAPQPWSATAYLAHNLLSRSLSAQLAHEANGLQFATRALERRYGDLNATHIVLPNQLAARPPTPTTRDGVTIGWGGSVGHREDVEALAPTLQRVLAQRPNVQLAFMGDSSFERLGHAIAGERFRFTPGGDLTRYYDFVRGLTIGLGPNLDTAFNQCRSDVKFLEYAAHGVVPVVADLPPYAESVHTGVNGVRYRSMEELEQWLLALIDDEALRQRLARQAFDDVSTTRLESAHAPRRLEWLRSLLEKPIDDRPPAGGHSRAAATELELLLYEGLKLGKGGEDERAAQLFRLAVKQRPSFHVAQLYLGQATPNEKEAARALAAARRAAPNSVAAHYIAGERALRRRDDEAAVTSFEHAHAVAPTMGAPAFQLSQLFSRRGQTDVAQAWLARALDGNPYFAAPPVQRALAALEQRDAQAARAALTRIEALDPTLWLTQFILGRAAMLERRFAEARWRFESALPVAADPLPVLAQLAQAALACGDTVQATAALEALRHGARPPRPVVETHAPAPPAVAS